MKKLVLLVLILGAVFTVQSCKKNKENPQGQMEVRMTDSPGDFIALNVQILKVEAYLDNSGWVTLNETMQEINVLDLTNGAEVTLSSATNVQPGLYTRLRLTFSGENTLTFNSSNGPETVNLSVDASYSHQVEIPIHCTVNSRVVSSVLIDFNVGLSIKQQSGAYVLEPVIREIADPSTGIQGQISGTSQAAVTLSNGMNTYGTYINDKGYFILRGVADGTYLLKIEGKKTGDLVSMEKNIQNVTISNGQIKSLGMVQL